MPEQQQSRRQGPYPRPYIEIEYDQAALQAEGCCRFVRAVIRVCGVPKGVMNNAHFERTRAYDKDGTPRSDYECHPSNPYRFRKLDKKAPGDDSNGVYQEFHVELLTRSQEDETGLFQFTMESQSYSKLTDITFCFVACLDEPVVHGEAKGVKEYRCVPYLRTEEDRDALRGEYPQQVKGVINRRLGSSSALPAQSKSVEGLEMPTMF